MVEQVDKPPLVTPCEARLPLTPATAATVAALNASIARGAVRDASGARVRLAVDGLLVAADGRAFAVRGGIANLFPDSWLVLSPAELGAE